MPSKYDRYWLEKLDDIAKLIEEAYIRGTSSKLDVSDVREYGNRQNWYGVVEVSDKISKGEMAHARSLGRIALERGLVSSYNCAFRFVISSNLKLRVVRLGGTENRSIPRIAECVKRTSMASKVIESIEDRKKNLAKILSEISLEAWNRIVKEEPEWHYMKPFLSRYGFGPFATLMVVTGLNDFKLKGRAEVAYWPKISNILESSPVPESPRGLYTILEQFYRNELYNDLKVNRLSRFLFSPLAEKLWNSTPKTVSREFPKIWKELAYTMRQNPEAKTISFAMKCLAISLLMVGEYDFDFSKIPIPVDYRVRTFSKKAGLVTTEDDNEIRQTWQNVLELIKGREPKVTMIHLDSLVWQIARMSKKEMLEYLSKMGCQSVGEKIVSFLIDPCSIGTHFGGENLKLCVVPCGSRKIWDVNPNAGPTKARDVYIGAFAKACREYAEKFYPNSYVILSAKYGFLFPDDIVPEPYNVTFNDPSTNPISVEELRKQAEEKGLMKYDEIVVIAGSNYANIVRKVFKGKRVTTPLSGLGGIGHMISTLKRAISEGREL
ncbi:DUF7664 domain-containing protein [Archaeoglobus veneficus]|uniref:Uncharacterized protein n=1 Tax=Archaeoglobus veneficus (strain DSM 11195 / SNP6) TaxID=693661 RepID=F2KS33_ARCVS|nr:N-glycosylase/DNA lyase [Archaeoglobus veneficus]AEA46874.1 hypothetical protein Arcve_0860 [Archaeoglobus veneficus SNP6]